MIGHAGGRAEAAGGAAAGDGGEAGVRAAEVRRVGLVRGQPCHADGDAGTSGTLADSASSFPHSGESRTTFSIKYSIFSLTNTCNVFLFAEPVGGGVQPVPEWITGMAAVADSVS